MNAADLAPVFGADVHPVSAARMAEQHELLRIAAQSALDRSSGGCKLVPDVRAWAEHWAATKPLGRPLSTGEPT